MHRIHDYTRRFWALLSGDQYLPTKALVYLKPIQFPLDSGSSFIQRLYHNITAILLCSLILYVSFFPEKKTHYFRVVVVLEVNDMEIKSFSVVAQ